MASFLPADSHSALRACINNIRFRTACPAPFPPHFHPVPAHTGAPSPLELFMSSSEEQAAWKICLKNFRLDATISYSVDFIFNLAQHSLNCLNSCAVSFLILTENSAVKLLLRNYMFFGIGQNFVKFF